MHNNFYFFLGKKNNFSSLFFFTIFFLEFSSACLSQTKNNIEVFFNLADSAANSIIENMPSKLKPVKVHFDLSNDYSVFNNRILADLKSNGVNVVPVNLKDTSYSQINFTISDAQVNYKNMFRESFLGKFYLERNIMLIGNYSISDSLLFIKKFSYVSNDTVSYNSIGNIQSSSYPFAKGEIPAEPFISSFWEPLVAIGATATAVLLFFTIRSK